MPLRVRWRSKENFSIAMLFLGACGFFQVLIIFISQYLLAIGNVFVIFLIPLGVTFALFIAALIIYEAYLQVERREKLRSQYKTDTGTLSKIRRFLNFPIVRPLIIIFIIFLPLFFMIYFIFFLFLDNALAFLFAEIIPAIIILFVANYFEKNYAKIRRF